MVPDYYARLEVDPRADRAEIEAALQRKQPAWSMGTRNPKNRHTYQLYLDEIPALRRALLSDLASRAAYDAELAVAQRSEREQRLDELQRRVRLRAAKGGLGASDREHLVAEATRLGLNEDDLLRLIRPIPSLVEAASAQRRYAELDIDPPADVLDPSTRRQLRVALEHLGCRDLYDALGVTRDAPASDIAARADAERQRWMKKAQVTAEKTAWLEVIAHAQSHLGSPRSRSRYDRTLALEAEEAFDSLAEFGLKGLGRLDPGTRAALIAEAAALGIAPDRADRLIGRDCRRLGVARDAASAIATPVPIAPTGRRPLSTGLVIDGQRRGPVHPAAMPGLRGRDRDQPGGSQGRHGAMPALRGVAAMGLPGLPTHAVGRRAAMRLRVPDGDARAGAPALRGGAAGVPRLRLRRRGRAPGARPRAGPGPRRGAERPGPRPAASGRPGPAQAGLSVGAGRRPAGRGPVGGRVLEPPGRSAVARDPGRLDRAGPPAPPRRGAGGPRAQARTDRSPGGPELLSAEPRRSPPTSRTPSPAWPARRPTRRPPWTPRCWATASA